MGLGRPWDTASTRRGTTWTHLPAYGTCCHTQRRFVFIVIVTHVIVIYSDDIRLSESR